MTWHFTIKVCLKSVFEGVTIILLKEGIKLTTKKLIGDDRQR
jgi:hypothetical protein